MNPDRRIPNDWFSGIVPDNVILDPTAYLETTYSFQLFRSRHPTALAVGRGTSIYLGVMFDFGPQASMRIGDYVLMNGARLICDKEITIGDHCLISWNVVLMDTYRLPRETAKRRAELERLPQRSPRGTATETEAKPIHIEPNVWIGFDSCVLPGVTIGRGAVVGARSVVTIDVPSYTVVAGNPARILRQLQPETRPADPLNDQASA
jgi:acetyltransferase-like isoleucine patch superfamily enzyme